jgi:hypothetical protein
VASAEAELAALEIRFGGRLGVYAWTLATALQFGTAPTNGS